MAELSKGRAKLAACVGVPCALLLLAIVPNFEGNSYSVYRDIGGVPTVCNGHTGPEVKMGQVYTPEQCEDLLVKNLIKHAQPVLKCTPGLEGHTYVLAAAVSITYNIGETAYCNSTMAKKFNVGDLMSGCKEITRWNRVNGREVAGLTKRRAVERALCERTE